MNSFVKRLLPVIAGSLLFSGAALAMGGDSRRSLIAAAVGFLAPASQAIAPIKRASPGDERGLLGRWPSWFYADWA
ncbi:hypothetical protein [Serratia sp. NA_13]|uniref:hypothetical protein n=1 Tax=Serratia sp. NA_13 TaxID=3415658 RepID=UPI004046C051